MEKYRKYADPSTGINPFVSSALSQRVSIVKQCLWLPYSLTLIFTRLFCLSFVWLGEKILACLPSLLADPLCSLLARLRLLCSGVYYQHSFKISQHQKH